MTDSAREPQLRDRRKASDAYLVLRHPHGWQISCARCGSYNVLAADEDFAIEPMHRILDLHYCGEPPL